ncbi:MAG: SemiSWEET family transporter [Candidatus Nanogingivalis sp.]
MKKSKNKDDQSAIRKLGVVASFVSVVMYVSYLPQIMDNLAGAKANPIQPMVAMINCTCWVIYAYFKEERDWPIVIANLPGIIFGAVAFLTSLQVNFRLTISRMHYII